MKLRGRSRTMVALWLCLLVALGACSADSLTPEGTGGAPSAPQGEPTSGGAMTASLRMAVLRAQQKAAGYAFTRDASGTLRSRAGGQGAGAEVTATPRGVRVSRPGDGGFQLGIETTSVGRAGSRGSRGVLDQRAEGQELVLDREEGVEERYLAGPLGVEQSFVVATPPEGSGSLTIEVAFTGLTPELAGGAPSRVLLRDAAGRVRAGYRDLVAVDAEGRELGARMEPSDAGVTLVVDDTGAVYPLRIDPVAWTQQAELTASDGAAGDELGYSVAVSGATAIVGAYGHTVGSNAYQGAAYLFVQSGTTWVQEAELTASDGAANDRFGFAVAMNGLTMVVGAYQHTVGSNAQQGAAYIFVYNGDNCTQTAELTASDGAAGDLFGQSVAVSGGQAVVGASEHTVGSNAQQGAAYVFVQSGATWPQQAELTASDGAPDDLFGSSVAMSGGTAVVGAGAHQVGANAEQGAAYVFAQSGTAWTQQAELTASDGAPDDLFGQSVAVSGGTALVGAGAHQVGANAEQGAAYVFVQSGAAWTQQAELTASDGAAGDDFGCSVAVSGGTALVGALYHQVGANAGQGAAYAFLQSGTSWTPEAELTASDGAAGDTFGTSVGVSAGVVFVGAPARNGDQGAAYVFDSCNIGGAAYPSGTVNPANPCQICDPAISGTAWTAWNTAMSCGSTEVCDDGLCETGCWFELGVVAPGSRPPLTPECEVCDPAVSTLGFSAQAYGTPCWESAGVCNGSGLCLMGDCFIGGVLYTYGAENPSNPCQICNAFSPNAWFAQATGTSCGTGTVCSSSGACVAECFIGGVLYPAGTVSPASACQVCTPSSSTTAWSHVTDGTPCDDGNACTASDACTAGTCAGTPFTCAPADCQASATCNGASCTIVNAGSGAACTSDGNPCHADTCDGAGSCSHANLPDGTACGTGDVCQAGSCGAECFLGGVVVGSGTFNPANACEACAPSISTTSWSPVTDGTACNDGDPCTSSDVCTSGTCAGTAYTCAATSCQQSSTCDGAGGCTVVNAAAGAACPSDGNPCHGDTCDGAGHCAHPNLADGTACGAGVECVSGSCGPGCTIAGMDIPPGTINTANACQACVPGTSTSQWTNRADGAACDDGNACTSSDVCAAGACAGTPFTCTPASCQQSSTCNGTSCTIVEMGSGVACPSDGNPCHGDACDGAGNCAHPDLPDGSSCGAGLVCSGGACLGECFIGEAAIAAGTPDPANPCEVCAPAISTTGWSSVADGTACDDGDACTSGDVCTAGACGGALYTCTATTCQASSTCDGNGGCTVVNAASGVTCPSDGNPCHGDACDGAGNCAHPNLVDGTACGDGTCQAGVCAAAPDAGPDAGEDAGSGTGAGGSTTSSSTGTGTGGGSATTSGSSGTGGATSSSTVGSTGAGGSTTSATTSSSSGTGGATSSSTVGSTGAGGSSTSASTSSSSGTGGATSSSTVGNGGATASSSSGSAAPPTYVVGGGGCEIAGDGVPGSPVPWPVGALGLLVLARRRARTAPIRE